MKYLDILKEYDRTIVTESKKLDVLYRRLLGEGCEGEECKKDDEASAETTSEGCDKDKQMTEFDEDEESAPAKKDSDTENGEDSDTPEKADAPAKKTPPSSGDKKMLSPEEFFETDGSVSEDDILKGGIHNGHIPESENDDAESDTTSEAADADAVRAFFGVSKSGKGDDEEADTADETPEDVSEGAEANQKMSASEIFAETDDADEDADGEKPVETTASEPEDQHEAEPEDKSEDKPVAEPEAEPDGGKKKADKKKKVDECGKMSMREIMALENTATEPDDDAKEPEESSEPSDEELEEQQLNESIQAITRFVKANKKRFG